MKLAITADVHLRSEHETPERYRALEEILHQCESEQIGALIIAGDLFDQDYVHTSELEKVCRDHPSVTVHIIPGNHDASLSAHKLVGDRSMVHDQPTVLEFEGRPFLLLPYRPNSTMADEIGPVAERIEGQDWVLVAHGDYTGGPREPNPLEMGTYMPLSRACLERYRPQTVFLGHIHKPANHGVVWIPGSPCPLDISETGRRRFLVYDTADGSVQEQTVTSDTIYFWETFLVLPGPDEVPTLEKEISSRIATWDLGPGEEEKVQLRIEAIGYATDRAAVLETLRHGFDGFAYAKDAGPDVERLIHNTDRQLLAIATRTQQVVRELDWDLGGDEPTREQVMLEALKTVYGM